MVGESTSTFEMRSARGAMIGGLGHIEEEILAIERSMGEDPSFVFDISRSLVESVCKSILSERGIEYEPNDDLPRLFKLLIRQMPLLPTSESNATDVRRSLEKTINGLHTTIQGICELRNRTGFSHGSAGPRTRLENSQARMVAEAADAIVGFLYRIHRQDRTPPLTYGDNLQFNQWIDDTHDRIRIIDVEFNASEVLFQMEPKGYEIHLADFQNQEDFCDPPPPPL